MDKHGARFDWHIYTDIGRGDRGFQLMNVLQTGLPRQPGHVSPAAVWAGRCLCLGLYPFKIQHMRPELRPRARRAATGGPNTNQRTDTATNAI